MFQNIKEKLKMCFLGIHSGICGSFNFLPLHGMLPESKGLMRLINVFLDIAIQLYTIICNR